jgi:hypothetical protein
MKNDNNNENDDAFVYLFWDYIHHKECFGITEQNDGFIDAEDPQICFYK